MKITRNARRDPGTDLEVSLAEAVEASCLRNDRWGQAEIVGILAEVLHRSGLLTEQDVSKMLSYRYKVES